MPESLETIIQINDNDIICGRKGVALKQPGNLAYRKIVGLNKELYATCRKNEKLRVSKSIVAAMRDVGGRFLERVDGKTSLSLVGQDEDGSLIVWRDIGDKRAVEKTSQALREGQPKLLKELARKQTRPMIPPQAYYYNAAAAAAMNVTTNYPYTPYIPQPATHRYDVSALSHLLHQTVATQPVSALTHLLNRCESDLLMLALLVEQAKRKR